MRVHLSCIHNEREMRFAGFFRAFEHTATFEVDNAMVCSLVRGAICNPLKSFECACLEQSSPAYSHILVSPTNHVVVLFLDWNGSVVEVFLVVHLVQDRCKAK